MSNEENVELEDEIVEPQEVEDGEDDSTDYKALAAKNAGIAKRYKTKFEKSKIAVKIEKGVEKELDRVENNKTDYAKLAYLAAEGVPQEDRQFVLEEAKTAGKDLDAILQLKYLREELKDRKEAREAKAALPTGSKRSAGASRDSVEYHLAKGTKLSEILDVELRRKVLKAKIADSKIRPGFSKQSVV